MDIERLTKLAEWLENGAKHERISFDMREGIVVRKVEDVDPSSPDTCQTACCLAGAATQFFDPAWVERMWGDVWMGDRPAFFSEYSLYEDDDPTYSTDNTPIAFGGISGHAQDLLDLSWTQAHSLFTPGNFDADYNDPAWAARVIRRLIATGKVDWDAEKEA